jgi:GNAT superfamily N-acetyltransferase
MASSSGSERSLKGSPGTLRIRFSVVRAFPYQKVKAFKDGKSVGLFVYRLGDQYIRANGTEVLPEYQGQGIGVALWDAVIKKHKPKGVVVSTVSEAGERLVKKLRARYPELDWDHW